LSPDFGLGSGQDSADRGAPRAFFLPGCAPAGGQRLALFHAPQTPQAPPRGAVLFLHAFAEEMNKSRRMAALASRALAASGFAVLQVDLMGCGDSSGDIEQASWSAWVDDAVSAAQWLQQRQAGPLWLWGERSGCLVAAEAAPRIAGTKHFLFWQPQGSGKLLLQQFLRLKMASQMQRGATKGVTEGLLADLAEGRTVEVAGYRLGPALALGMAAASLQRPPSAVGASRLVWLEVTSRVPPALLPASAPLLAQWRDAGYAVASEAVAGPPFWQTVEIEDAPELVRATTACLLQAQSVDAAPVLA
jgi:exosortase A-associated hydrolase 2